MKISGQQIQSFIQNAGNGSFSCLLYGPDYGVKADVATAIEKQFLGVEFAQNIINLDFSNPEEASKMMFSEVLNYDLLPSKKVIKIKSAGNKLTQSIQTLLAKENDINRDIFIILIGDELDPKSSLRLFYETHNLLGSIGCYADTTEDSTRMVAIFLNEHKIKFDLMVPKFIASCFIGDRMALKNELLKISLYFNTNQQLNVEICQKIIDNSLAYTPDIFLDSIGLGDFKTASIELDRAFNEGNSSIGIIRFCLFHFLKLKEMLINVKQGSNIDQEITKSRIFFKRVPNYRKQLSILTISKVNIVLSKLLLIETKIKQYNEDIGILILKSELIEL